MYLDSKVVYIKPTDRVNTVLDTTFLLLPPFMVVLIACLQKVVEVYGSTMGKYRSVGMEDGGGVGDR